jgi:hypothetical protein
MEMVRSRWSLDFVKQLTIFDMIPRYLNAGE